MPESLADLLTPRRPTADRPLLGLTVLLVEDSRFASEAIRLMCQQSGARLRRADSLATARRHLSLYRPTVVMVDLGLPDGSGLDLIAELDRGDPRVPILLACSGDPSLAPQALQAGAQAFLEKPLRTISTFQETVLANLPSEMRPMGPRVVPNDEIDPDRFALRDDLHRLSDLIAGPCSAEETSYAAQFLSSVARSAGDSALASAAEGLAAAAHAREDVAEAALQHVTGLIQDRLSTASQI